MYRYFGISFSTKANNWAKLKKAIVDLADALDRSKLNKKVILVHAFMPRALLADKGIDTNALDLLEDKFPLRINCYHGGAPMREEMANLLKANNGEVYVIGAQIEGVATEVAEYRMQGIKITSIPIEP